ALFSQLIERCFQLQRTRGQVVSIARQEVHGAGVKPLLGHFLRGASKPSRQRLRRDLNVATLPQPSKQALGLGSNQGVALRVSDDGMEASKLQFVQGLVQSRRNGEIRKFDQEIVLLVQREALRRGLDLLQILKTEMEIASRG